MSDKDEQAGPTAPALAACVSLTRTGSLSVPVWFPSQCEAGGGEGEAGQEQVHMDFVCTKVTLHAANREAQGSEGPLPGCVMPMTLPLLKGRARRCPVPGRVTGCGLCSWSRSPA